MLLIQFIENNKNIMFMKKNFCFLWTIFYCKILMRKVILLWTLVIWTPYLMIETIYFDDWSFFILFAQLNKIKKKQSYQLYPLIVPNF